jgi:ribosomal protein S18 acetylase RimI-like enzyme
MFSIVVRAPAVHRVRFVRPGDLAFVREVAAAVFAEYGDPDGTRTVAMVSAPGAVTLVAELDGAPAGFAIVQLDREPAHLTAIAVAPRVSGIGVGPRLLRAVERYAAERGAQSMRLETGEANVVAIELFVRAGYTRVGRMSRYYRTGYDAITYRKNLRPSEA